MKKFSKYVNDNTVHDFSTIKTFKVLKPGARGPVILPYGMTSILAYTELC